MLCCIMKFNWGIFGKLLGSYYIQSAFNHIVRIKIFFLFRNTIIMFKYLNTIHLLFIYLWEAQFIFLFLGWRKLKKFENRWTI